MNQEFQNYRKYKPKGYWTKDRCVEDALKYKSITEWHNKSQNVYLITKKYNWFTECIKHMMPPKYKPKGYWTKDRCIEDAKKYSTKWEWSKKSPSSNKISKKYNWFSECVKHMKINTKPKGYWTKDRCIEEAKNYNSRKEWSTKHHSSYIIAHRNKWLEECCNHMIKVGNSHYRAIYAIEFPDNHVYIGLTHDIKERIYNHYQSINSKVNIHMKKSNIQPIIKQLTEYIHKDIATKKEEIFLLEYKNLNWIILNKAKTGGLGGGKLIWTKDRCIEDALLYSTKNEWVKNSNTAYKKASKMKWLEECCGHMKSPIKTKISNNFTLDQCKELALKFNSRVRFKEKYSGAYSKILKNTTMKRYIKDSPRIIVKFVREATNDIILEVPITAMEVHDYLKTDYIHSVIKNTFGQDRIEEIGNVIVVIDQRYVLS
jgi:predicted GIY-YIG superfamily endonuclease